MMETDNWPKHPNGENKTIGEMTDEESRPILRAAFLRSKIGDLRPDLKDAFSPPLTPQHGE
jgi:hypothetical protein